MKKSIANTYKSLLTRVTKEFADLEEILKRRTVEGYWRIGRHIDEHLLHHKHRADYGATVYERLAKDTDRDKTTLMRATQFYRTYPILADQRKLTWDHYKRLITIKDDKERKTIEEQAVRQDWSTTKLGEYLATKRELSAPDENKSVPQLTFNRGRLNTYQIVKANKTFISRGPLALDLGFRQQHLIPEGVSVKEGDIVELINREGKPAGGKKVEVAKNEIFTYQACVEKIIDGDTLLVSFDFHLDVSISQKLRLRGIDCPELDTEEGKKAKRFVESRLKDCEFIIVKTYKDRSDKWDRYVVDIFYQTGTRDSHLVAPEGIYLNQELLDNHLAVVWK